jgi:hypothetical protein
MISAPNDIKDRSPDQLSEVLRAESGKIFLNRVCSVQ